MSKYIGTFVVPGQNPKDVIYSGGRVKVRDSFARRRGPISKAAAFLRACVLWARVQRLGSRA